MSAFFLMPLCISGVVVTNCTDADLRSAIASGGTVTFACDGTVVLTNTLIITSSTVIDGSGHSVTLSGNDAVRILQINSGQTLTLSNLSLIRGKVQTGGGGAAVFNVGGVLRAYSCLFATNNASYVGGAIYKSGLVELNNCAFIGNHSDSAGGAIGSNDANPQGVLATNCTFFGNSSPNGGALQGLYGDCWVVNCTIVSNSLNALYSYPGAFGHITVRNSIIAGSSGPNCVGVIDGGYNVLSDASSGFTNAFTVLNANPHLGPLALNGGTTPSMLPQADSPAIDAADNSGAPATDQRGLVRPFGLRCDVGATEASVSGTQPGELRFQSVAYSAAENGGSVLITVVRAGGSAGSVTVGFSTANDTAIAGTDYVATNGTLTFPSGSASASFAVALINDSISKPDRMLGLRLTNPLGGASLGASNATLSVIEDDVGFSFGAPSYNILEKVSSLTIYVFRLGPKGQTCSVSYATSDGTAVAGLDFVGTNGVLTFAGETNKTITIPILNDALVEGNESASVTLFNPTGGATLGNITSATVTILDDDVVLGACTESALRAALSTADTVYFGCDGVIVLTNTLVISRSVVLDGGGHQVTLSGGGTVRPFSVGNGVQFTLKNVTVANGVGSGTGGGAMISSGETRLLNCTFSNNVINGLGTYGGAVFFSSPGTLHVDGCAFLFNQAGSVGGALGAGGFAAPGRLNVTNSTFVGNSSQGGAAVAIGCASGGVASGNIVNSTFAGNTNGGLSYCLGVPGATNRMLVINSLFSSNNGPNCSGITDGGYNISSDASGSFAHPFSLENVDGRLGSLANNGGPTLTMALLPDSPAIDGGSSSVMPPTDQRGVGRPFGAASDAGAFEFTSTGTSAGIFQVFAVTNSVGETAGGVGFTIIRAGGTVGAASVQFATVNGTAAAGSDYVATNGVLQFAAGQQSNSVFITVHDDSLVEGNETFSLQLSNPTGGAGLGRAVASMTILDNDSSFQFASAGFSATEGAGSIAASVVRLGDATAVASVNFATAPGSALVGSDFIATNGTLNFAAGQTNATITVTLVTNVVPEPTETFSMQLSNPTGGAVLGIPSTATLTILDDDPVQPGTLQFGVATVSVSEDAGEACLTVLRTGGTNGNVTVGFSANNGSAVGGSDFRATNGTVLFGDTEIRKTIRVGILADAVAEGPEQFTVTLSNPTGGAAVGAMATVTVTIIDGTQTLTACNEASLRQAVSAGGRIQLNCDGVIYLSAPLQVSVGVNIDGTGHSISISGNHATNLFVIQPGVTLGLRHLSLVDGLSVGGTGGTGQAGGVGQGGAVINSNGVLRAVDCSFVGHRAQGGSGGPAAPPTLGPAGSGGWARGGAICNLNGEVELLSCLLASNQAAGGPAGTGNATTGYGGEAWGGVVYTEAGAIHIDSSVLSNNLAKGGPDSRFGSLGGAGTAASYGGAVFNSGEFVCTASRLAGNWAAVDRLSGAAGGAVYHNYGTLSFTDCTVDQNRATGGVGLGISTPLGLPGGPGLGGAIYLAAGEARFTNSTLANNRAAGGSGVPNGAGAGVGGGIYNAASLALVNVTLFQNTAVGGPGPSGPSGNGEGGGLYNANAGSISLTHVTLAGNSAYRGSGGGAMSFGFERGGAISSGGGVVLLRNSILAYSTNGSNWFGTGLVDAGNNLSSDASCNFTTAGSLNNSDPRLGPFASYGGPTWTLGLLAGSPAINAAAPAYCTATDQRGRPRPFGAACDIGAFESSEPYTVLGRITGYQSPQGMAVGSGATFGVALPDGTYSAIGFPAGVHLLTPSSPDVVFVPSNRVVNVGPDIAGVNFHAYRSNAFLIELAAGPAVHGTFAGAVGQTWRILTSPNLIDWTPFSTNTVQSSGLFEFVDPQVPQVPSRYFKAVSP